MSEARPITSGRVVAAGLHDQRRRCGAADAIGFWIFDNNAVALETPTAAIKVTRPKEIACYVAMFNHLHSEAVHGENARRLIADVHAELTAGDR